ncbi:MAG TPA: hypothetical protein VM577_14545 [Anaerovoracaceae bacterium]|nr:hypothetical protein [Anaerovoracaceae bacterium]
MANPLEIAVSSLDDFFAPKIQTIPNCHQDTKSYINGIFVKPKIDLSNQSITLVYAQAISNYRFDLFQTVGDWLLFAKSLYPQHLKDASPEYYNVLAQCSYYKCYRIVNRQWPIFEELADMFPHFVDHIQQNLRVDSSEHWTTLPRGVLL